MAVVEVRYPEARREIFQAVEGLAQREYRSPEWYRQQPIEQLKYYHSVSNVVTALYDDSAFVDGAINSAIGKTLANQTEAKLVHELLAVFDPLLNQTSNEQLQEVALHPDWPSVANAAAALRDEMKSHGVLD